MDGNGRWAEARNLARTEGHRVGIERVREIIKAAEELGIGYLTFFAFSTENWKRPKGEVDMLMRSLEQFIRDELDDLNRRNIRFRVIGREEPVPPVLQKSLKSAEELTKNNSGMTVVLAFNYGARAEIVDATKKIAGEVQSGKLKGEAIDENIFPRFLYAPEVPDPDLFIRTSGEMRISNFLLWQLSYTELHFTEVLWPDFTKADLVKAIEEFNRRERRYGDIKKAD